MITISTYNVYEYLKQKFPDLSEVLKNGAVDNSSDKSIGVFMGSDTRSEGSLALGGIDCTAVRMLPVNLMFRWSDNQKEHDELVNSVYDALLAEECNFTVNDVKFAYIEPIDGHPRQLGRDNMNVCESIIRLNVFYYV